ncbi:ECF subfamily RNA polymerase sigma-24 subunit [Intrasporangium oryzae NRRL B-24470]|uniref:ECF subfamily RNA polymerase sigma-24 subunit n=1 Tax=Intrasporangium oryzae NRRL B-24470 TaxID=1386089 RepID=W9GDV6_9MICO|nr:sigma-70 family RNA polymerase sigma factor [Intrasporangium oryzae]EWT02024.1 ECF subfamily RNA polymerase sigma-24 subunit [Intrasporangium oryzae NRRL B-24470]
MGEPSGLTELVAAASEGDALAWNAIVERFSSLLWGVARAHRLGPDDAADVVQNTWLRLLDHLGGIRQPEALAGWLATTARNESLSMLRRRGRDVVVRDDDLAVNLPDIEAVALDTALLDDERDAELWSCFARLPERCQELLRVLMSCDRPSYGAVAEALDMPVGSIGPTRMRCLNQLRDLVAGSGYAFEGGRP